MIDEEEAIDAILSRAARIAGQSPEQAFGDLRAVLARDPDNARAMELLRAALRDLGHADWLERAERMRQAVSHPRLAAAARLLQDGKIGAAERLLRPHLAEHPGDVAGLRMMAGLARRVGRDREAVALLKRALSVSPADRDARFDLALVLYHQGKLEETVAQLDTLIESEPDSLRHLELKAATLGRAGRYGEATALSERALQNHPDNPVLWTNYGHMLRIDGRLAESITAYRRAIALAPSLGSAWWSLANLKTVRLDDVDIAAMTAIVERGEPGDDDRFQIHFALGKAREDQGRFEEAFAHYAEANRLRAATLAYDPDVVTGQVDRGIASFSKSFFDARRGYGSGARDPIFVVGMPRAGSTLIEQILASHPAIEGTAELPYLNVLVRVMTVQAGRPYPDVLEDLPKDGSLALATDYLAKAGSHRRTDRPLFVDKNPSNWLNAGLIHLLFPHAAIVDVRRHPLGCCLSNFKQHFAQGQAFAYTLSDCGHYYRDYVRMMDHLDAVLPGRVHRIFYERLITDTEQEVRRLLDHVGVPFDEACLRFYENDRAIRTPSSEQVRRPINRDGMDRWRDFEPWLGPLKEALGTALDDYPTG